MKHHRMIAFLRHIDTFMEFVAERYAEDEILLRWTRLSKQTFSDVWYELTLSESNPQSIVSNSAEAPLAESYKQITSPVGTSEELCVSGAQAPKRTFEEAFLTTELVSSTLDENFSTFHNPEKEVDSLAKNQPPCITFIVQNEEQSQVLSSILQQEETSNNHEEDLITQTSFASSSPDEHESSAAVEDSYTNHYESFTPTSTTPVLMTVNHLPSEDGNNLYESSAPTEQISVTSNQRTNGHNPKKVKNLTEKEVEEKLRKSLETSSNNGVSKYAHIALSFDTIDNCVEAYCTVQKLVNNDRTCIIHLSALQGQAVHEAKVLSKNDFDRVHRCLIEKGMDYSAAHIHFQVRLFKLVNTYTRLRNCALPLRFFLQYFPAIKKLCSRSDEWR